MNLSATQIQLPETGDALTMKGNRALMFHPDEIENSFTGEPQAKLVHVSGSGPNVFGHTLLCFNVGAGYY